MTHLDANRRDDDAPLPKVVIIGAGFGGLAAAKTLARAPVRVTVIDRRNHHLFQPLLYQVATAGLAPNQIATPIRAIVRKQKNAHVALGMVEGIDTANKAVMLGAGRVSYDYLIVATGARHAYFGHDEWERFAPGLKTLEDATEQRKRILLAFERAELEDDPAERARLTTFIVIGGGPTGVETAGAIAELAKKALARDYRRIDPKSARIVLIEAATRLLGAFPEDLSEHARRALEKLGVEVRLGHAVTDVDEEGVTLGDEGIDSRTVIWAAGVQSSPAARWLDISADRAGRAIIDADLRAPGHDEIFVIGDCAAVNDANGKPLPGVAPVAKQQGAYAARAILAAVKGERLDKPFRYVDYGNLATVGRQAAIADFRGFHLKGFIGWLVWCAAHIYYLIGFKNRIAVALDWTWSYLTFERGARLITGDVVTEAPYHRDKREAA
ncbi:NAD(P)/FAD-dependent oxidoreductase [Terricaulis silvestris]|uniref:NADH:ubiquinone reductase (non-electrogenic) n=1 Tax=Terricaulis silvestris TaxID=2686094 RepID=A0A6I6MRS0_9CAUL|nr:NAD(P)/FAD-dependent oxidoreductase [Terricaulis silvestris]QGZ96088.1 NADH dehydrogenase-like protein YjlD [Terricaulis silvestris]